MWSPAWQWVAHADEKSWITNYMTMALTDLTRTRRQARDASFHVGVQFRFESIIRLRTSL